MKNPAIRKTLPQFLRFGDPALLGAMIAVFSFPFFKKFPAIVFAVWLLTAIFTYRWAHIWKLFSRNSAALLTAVLYVMGAVSLIYTDKLQAGVFKLEVKLLLLLLPFLLAPAAYFSAKQFKMILHSFVAGIVLSAIINYCISAIQFFKTGDSAWFFYDKISHFHHPSYYAMYICLALLGMAFFLRSGLRLKWYWAAALIALLLSMMFFLSSKAGLVSLFVIMLIESLGLLFHSFNFKNLAILLATLSMIVVFSVYNYRIQEAVLSMKQIQPETETPATKAEDNDSSTGLRLEAWQASLKLLPQHWLIGTGQGDVTPDLLEQYRKMEMNGPAEKSLNCHNQFLQTQLGLGLIGLLLLMAIIIMLFVKSLLWYRRLIIGFLLIILINFMFESMLETQSGIQFIIFFICLLAYMNENKTYDPIFTSPYF